VNFIITTRYSDIFDGEKPKLEGLLSDIPSTAVIGILFLINAEPPCRLAFPSKLIFSDNQFDLMFLEASISASASQ
jgi:hypothetical protein